MPINNRNGSLLFLQNTSLDIAPSLLPRSRYAMFKAHAHTQTVEKRSPNKLLIADIKTILNNHKIDPETWNIEYIAQNYQIDQQEIGKRASFYLNTNLNSQFLTDHSKNFNFTISAKLLTHYSSPDMECAEIPSTTPKRQDLPNRVHAFTTSDEMAELVSTPGGKKYISLAERMDQVFSNKE